LNTFGIVCRVGDRTVSLRAACDTGSGLVGHQIIGAWNMGTVGSAANVIWITIECAGDLGRQGGRNRLLISGSRLCNSDGQKAEKGDDTTGLHFDRYQISMDNTRFKLM